MKAWVLQGVDDLRWETVEEPILAKGEVLLQVKAAGICGSDIPRIYRTGAHVHPLIPGHEFSGLVVRTGPGVDPAWQGRRAGVFPLIPCRECLPCRKGQFEMCQNYGYLGSRRDGGFGEYAAVPAWNLIPLPEQVSYEEAAMLEPMAVAVHAMRRALPEKGETAVVCGLGTIGLLLLMFLREAGVQEAGRILVEGNKEAQRKMVLELGMESGDYCDSRTQDPGQWIRERTGGLGADVFFECVGKNETVAQAVENTAPGGRICLMGNPASSMALEMETYWKILRHQLRITGTWNSSFTHGADDDWNYCMERLGAKRVDPGRLITHRYSLEELHRGLHIMRDKTQDYIKIMTMF